jgi:hypothetical protein
MTRKSFYDSVVTQLPTSGHNQETVRLIELQALIKLKLGKPLDAAKFGALAEIQGRMRFAENLIAEELSAGKLSPEGYLDRITDVLQRARMRMVSVLGEETYQDIFGPDDGHPEAIDREGSLTH